MKNFANKYEDIINYLSLNYAFDGKFDKDGMGYTEEHSFEEKTINCACGEASGIHIYNLNMELIEVIIECKACYEKAGFRERI